MKTITQTTVASLKITALVLASAFVVPASAQHSYTYLFSEAPFTSIPPGGPVLEPIGPTTTPVTVTIPASTCADTPDIDLTYFEKNSGFKAKAFFTDRYSIEMIFKFDELESYNRIIDFSNSVSDHGIYTLYECLNFFPTGNIGPCPAFDTVNYKQIVITRNDVTKEMNVYVNGSLFTNHVDATDYYVIDPAPDDTIKFFKDDRAVTNEASPGHVSLIRMCDFELSPTDVVSSYNSFCHRITPTHEINPNIQFSIYPNPAKENLSIQMANVDFSKKITLTFLNIFGQQVMQIPVYSEYTNIDLGKIGTGIYFYQLLVDQATANSGKIIVD